MTRLAHMSLQWNSVTLRAIQPGIYLILEVHSFSSRSSWTMPMKFWKLPLYPLLIAAYYPLYMMAADQGMIDVSEVIRPTAVCVLLALLLMVLLGAILRDMHRAALWVAITVILIFGFRFVQRIIGRVVEGTVGPAMGFYILGGMTAIAILLRGLCEAESNMTRIANVVAAVMVVFPVTSLLQREFGFSAPRRIPARACRVIRDFTLLSISAFGRISSISSSTAIRGRMYWRISTSSIIHLFSMVCADGDSP